MRQVLLRQGEITGDDDEYFGEYKGENGKLPNYFDVKELRMIDMCRLAYWDESHRKCIIGGCSSRDSYGVYIIFPRDENNPPDINGTFTDNNGKRRIILNEKYPDEVRFCTGVAKVRSPIDGTISGIKFPLWNYSGKRVVS